MVRPKPLTHQTSTLRLSVTADGLSVTADEARNCQLKLLSCEAEMGRGDRSKGIGYLGVRPWLSLHGAEEGLRCEHTKGRRNGRHKRAASTLGA